VTLFLGEGAGPSAASDLAATLGTFEEVKSARELKPRGIDAASAMVLIDFVGGVLGNINSLWDLVTKIRGALGQKSIRGARVTLPNGARVELESVTRDELAQLIELAGGAPARGH
jgi:hypothetical protein